MAVRLRRDQTERFAGNRSQHKQLRVLSRKSDAKAYSKVASSKFQLERHALQSSNLEDDASWEITNEHDVASVNKRSAFDSLSSNALLRKRKENSASIRECVAISHALDVLLRRTRCALQCWRMYTHLCRYTRLNSINLVSKWQLSSKLASAWRNFKLNVFRRGRACNRSVVTAKCTVRASFQKWFFMVHKHRIARVFLRRMLGRFQQERAWAFWRIRLKKSSGRLERLADESMLAKAINGAKNAFHRLASLAAQRGRVLASTMHRERRCKTKFIIILTALRFCALRLVLCKKDDAYIDRRYRARLLVTALRYWRKQISASSTGVRGWLHHRRGILTARFSLWRSFVAASLKNSSLAYAGDRVRARFESKLAIKTLRNHAAYCATFARQSVAVYKFWAHRRHVWACCAWYDFIFHIRSSRNRVNAVDTQRNLRLKKRFIDALFEPLLMGIHYYAVISEFKVTRWRRVRCKHTMLFLRERLKNVKSERAYLVEHDDLRNSSLLQSALRQWRHIVSRRRLYRGDEARALDSDNRRTEKQGFRNLFDRTINVSSILSSEKSIDIGEMSHIAPRDPMRFSSCGSLLKSAASRRPVQAPSTVLQERILRGRIVLAADSYCRTSLFTKGLSCCRSFVSRKRQGEGRVELANVHMLTRAWKLFTNSLNNSASLTSQWKKLSQCASQFRNATLLRAMFARLYQYYKTETAHHIDSFALADRNWLHSKLRRLCNLARFLKQTRLYLRSHTIQSHLYRAVTFRTLQCWQRCVKYRLNSLHTSESSVHYQSLHSLANAIGTMHRWAIYRNDMRGHPVLIACVHAGQRLQSRHAIHHWVTYVSRVQEARCRHDNSVTRSLRNSLFHLREGVQAFISHAAERRATKQLHLRLLSRVWTRCKMIVAIHQKLRRVFEQWQKDNRMQLLAVGIKQWRQGAHIENILYHHKQRRYVSMTRAGFSHLDELCTRRAHAKWIGQLAHKHRKYTEKATFFSKILSIYRRRDWAATMKKRMDVYYINFNMKRALINLHLVCKYKQAQCMFVGKCFAHFISRATGFINRRRFNVALIRVAQRTSLRAALHRLQHHAGFIRRSRRAAHKANSMYLVINKGQALLNELKNQVDSWLIGCRQRRALLKMIRSWRYVKTTSRQTMHACDAHWKSCQLSSTMRKWMQRCRGKRRMLKAVAKLQKRIKRTSIRKAFVRMNLLACVHWADRNDSRIYRAHAEEKAMRRGLMKLLK